MPAGYLRTFAKVATMEEAVEVARGLLVALGDSATVSGIKIEPYYKEEGWIEVTPSFSEIDLDAVLERLPVEWVEAGECHVWNPEAHWNQGAGVRFSVPGVVWAVVETFDPSAIGHETIELPRRGSPQT